ncbi:MAG: hypothetical protein JW730_09155 [Anaerolineales bacterium]|nr:hypothetical protein [Anaerolineales bacterium]
MNIKLRTITIELLVISLLISGCGSGQSSGAAPEPASASLTLYLCANGSDKELTANCAAQPNEYSTANLYPKYNTTIDFVHTLAGDIKGESYTFDLWFASGGSSTFDAALIVQQSGQETVLASASFVVTGKSFTRYTQTVSGIDPTTTAGDILILRISPTAGDPGGVISKSVPEGASSVTIPEIK